MGRRTEWSSTPTGLRLAGCTLAGVALASACLHVSCSATGLAGIDAGLDAAITACGELHDAGTDSSLGSCFSNENCTAAEHCSFVGLTPDMAPIECCIPGARGTGDGGATCMTIDDCASAVCAYTVLGSFCSTPCTTNAECPSVLPSCQAVTTDAGPQNLCGLP